MATWNLHLVIELLKLIWLFNSNELTTAKPYALSNNNFCKPVVFVDVPKSDLFAFPNALVLPENKLVPDVPVPLLPNRPPLVPLVPNPPKPAK